MISVVEGQKVAHVGCDGVSSHEEASMRKKMNMRIRCPQCQAMVVQAKNKDGPNFCAECSHLFYLPEESTMPPWILGVLVILVANLQIMAR